MAEYDRGKWVVHKTFDGYYEVHNKNGEVVLGVSGNDEEAGANAQHIVEMHNKWDAFQAMYEALERIDTLLSNPVNTEVERLTRNIIKQALKLARGE